MTDHREDTDNQKPRRKRDYIVVGISAAVMVLATVLFSLNASDRQPAAVTTPTTTAPAVPAVEEAPKKPRVPMVRQEDTVVPKLPRVEIRNARMQARRFLTAYNRYQVGTQRPTDRNVLLETARREIADGLIETPPRPVSQGSPKNARVAEFHSDLTPDANVRIVAIIAYEGRPSSVFSFLMARDNDRVWRVATLNPQAD